MPFHVWLLIFNPVLVTIPLLVLLIWQLRRTGIWSRHKRIIMIACAGLYAVDTAFAIPRIAYSWQTPSRAVIHETIPLPRSLVLIRAGCRNDCQQLLVSGQLDDVILVASAFKRPGQDLPPVRYRAGWTEPNACPRERRSGHGMISDALLARGFCPIIEPAEIPADGIFVVEESFLVRADTRDTPFTSKYLTHSPPGRVIRFYAHEVQRRSNGKIEVLATRSIYSAPGLTVPLLVECWDRPDNIIWILPPGDTGCGFWRWFTWGGDRSWSRFDTSWVLADVFRGSKPAAQ